MEQERLDLVILRVAHRDSRAVCLHRGAPQKRVAGGAGGAFGVWRPVGGARSVERVTPRCRHRPHEVAVELAVFAPAVVEVGHREVQGDGGKDLAQDRQQGQRVGSA